MFEQGYSFRLATRNYSAEYPLLEKSIYVFKTRFKRTYIVDIHRYDFRVYVIKFHDKKHLQSKKRFSFVLNDFDISRVLKTVLNIALHILHSDNLASFAFVGAYKIEKEDEDTLNTQRFRIYKRVAEYFLGSETFIHTYEERSNSYLLVNRSNPQPEDLSENIINMFANTFQGIENL